MKTKQPSTISTGDIITISADGFCVRATDKPKNSSPVGIARSACGSNGYFTVDVDATGTVKIGEINDWNITWADPLPPYSCPKHGEIGEEVVQVTDPDGKEHYYCKKCAEEILSKATEEAIRWEDELTKRDFNDE